MSHVTILNLPPFNLQAVYIAPLKALVKERMDDWKKRFEKELGKK